MMIIDYIIMIFDIITIKSKTFLWRKILQKQNYFMFFDKKFVLTWSGFKRLRKWIHNEAPFAKCLLWWNTCSRYRKYFLAKLDNNENMLLLLLHQSSGLESASV